MNSLRHTEILPVLDRTLGKFIDAGKPRKGQVFRESIPYLGTLTTAERFRRIAANWKSSVNGRFRKLSVRWHPSSACVTIIDAEFRILQSMLNLCTTGPVAQGDDLRSVGDCLRQLQG